jgi:acyl-CoA dehydrogenase
VTAELRSAVREFIAEELSTGSFEPQCDAWLSGWDEAFSRRLAAHEWIGTTVPTKYGGGGRTTAERYVIVEELLAAGAPVAAHWVADRQVAPVLLRFGTEEQRRRYLPAICKGECYFAVGMSEPDAGSDLASLRTRADRVAGGWRIYGTKVWTTGLQRASGFVALVRTSPRDDRDRRAGLTQMLVDPHAEGLTVRPIVSMTGEHHFNEVFFDGVFVPSDMVIGEVGNGWAQVTAELAYERSGPERFLSTMPLIRAAAAELNARAADSTAQTLLGSIIVRISALRRLSLSVAAALDAGETPSVRAALVKDAGTRFEADSVEAVRQLLGIQPDPTGTPLQRLLAGAVLHAPGFTLRGGTNEVLRGIVARSLGLR